MEILYWIIWGIVGIALIYGIFQWIGMFLWSWDENGKSFTIKLIILFILFVTPAMVKEFAPNYYDASKIVLFLYIVALLGHRLWTKGLDKHDKEDSL